MKRRRRREEQQPLIKWLQCNKLHTYRLSYGAYYAIWLLLMLMLSLCVILEYGVCNIFLFVVFLCFSNIAGALVAFFSVVAALGCCFFGIFSLPTHCKFHFKRVVFCVSSLLTWIGRSLVFAGCDIPFLRLFLPSCTASVYRERKHRTTRATTTEQN